jgi:3-isopropylmalate dehydrogenase
VILGTQSHADYPAPEKGGRNISAAFRCELDLYANVQPFALARVPGQGRQQHGPRHHARGDRNFYPDRNMYEGWGEMMPSKDMAISVRKITAHCSERIAARCADLRRGWA